MISKAVIGLGFGDEGKGMFTDYLCSHVPTPLVIRYNGGHQAGHTVNHGKYDSVSHVFSNFGSGTLRDIPTYWSKFCTVDPIAIMREYDILKEKGAEPILYIDERCPVTTPYEVNQNLYIQKQEHGSCGVGFGATLKREEEFYSLTALDLFYPHVLWEKLKILESYYKGFISEINFFNDAVERLTNTKGISLTFDVPEYENFRNPIFEGAQGLMLDQNYGFFPHVTRSNTGMKNINEIYNKNYLDFRNSKVKDVYLITRAYQTRHGNGPMTTESKYLSHNIKKNEEETNITNYQGEFRRALLDVSLLEYAIKKDEYLRTRNCKLVITCLDHIENEHRFTYKGEVIYCKNEKEFINKISKLLDIKHILLSRNPYPTLEEVHY